MVLARIKRFSRIFQTRKTFKGGILYFQFIFFTSTILHSCRHSRDMNPASFFFFYKFQIQKNSRNCYPTKSTLTLYFISMSLNLNNLNIRR